MPIAEARILASAELAAIHSIGVAQETSRSYQHQQLTHAELALVHTRGQPQT